MSDHPLNYECPYCNYNKVETAAVLPYIRGFLIGYTYGNKRIIGCCSCVRHEIFTEVGKSLLFGWFSPIALMATPFLVVYGLGRGLFVFKNYENVKEQLAELGFAGPDTRDYIVKMAMCLAVTMIHADSKIRKSEVDMGVAYGEKIFEDFDEEHFRKLIAVQNNLPDAHRLAGMFSDKLTDHGKTQIIKYLIAIAISDNEIAKEERDLIEKVIAEFKLEDASHLDEIRDVFKRHQV